MKPFIILAVLTATFCYGQQNNYSITPPLDIKQTGWNKVLCMKNGNTLLFHFEPQKRILVKVFDSTHREIATAQNDSRVVDIFMIEFAQFKGLFEINGEAVMFIDQDVRGKHDLVMMRFNAANGKLIEDRLVGESKSENRRIQYFVMKNKEDDNYEILFCMDKRHPKQSDIFMVYFNNKHESIKEVQLDIARKKYDFLEVLGAESQPNGVLITLGLDKAVVYGGAMDLNEVLFAKPDHDSALRDGGSLFDHYVSLYYIPKDSSFVQKGLVNLSSEFVYPYYTLYTYNPFLEKLNLLLFSYKPIYNYFGLTEYLASISSDMFFSLDKYDMSAKLKMVRNGVYDLSVKDTGKPFQGLPVKMFTDENGLSTVVSQSYVRYGEPETSIRYNYQDYLNNIGITQFDDNGNELWRTELPLAQYYKSYHTYFNEKELSKRWQDQVMFGDLPTQVYNRQFLSFNTYAHDHNFYIICNDYDKNFSKELNHARDTVYYFEKSNVCYYKVDRKHDVTKHYLFGTPLRNEYKCSFIEGADFDEQRGEYATLVQYKKNDKITLRMAWCRLE